MKKLSFELFLLTEIKEWLFLTLFPQENINDLNQLRRNMTPFLKAVTAALSVELELGLDVDKDIKLSIIDDIIKNISAENSTSITINLPAQTYDILHAELDCLLDLK